jgi:hypothetical protein
MDLLERHEDVEPDYSPEIAEDIEALLKPEYRKTEQGSLVQEDPVELLYESSGQGEFELDEENSSRVRELLEPYGDATEEQRQQYFEERISKFRDVSLDEDTDIDYFQFDPYSVKLRSPHGGKVSLSKIDVGLASGDEQRYWTGQDTEGDQFLVTEDLLSRGMFYLLPESGSQEVEFYTQGKGFTGLDVREFPGLEIPGVMEIASEVNSDLDCALSNSEPAYDIFTDPIEESISRKTDDRRQEERIRRRIRGTEHRSKFASDPEDVFEKRMSGDLQPLLQVSDKKKNGGVDLRALFVGPETVPELEEDAYYGVFFGTKRNSENEQDKFGDDIDDPERYARDVLDNHGVI